MGVDDTIKVFSYGGGVQSTAALVLAARGEIDYKTFAFACTGEDSESPLTLEYVRTVAMPFAEDNGIDLIELKRQRRDGTYESLLEQLKRRQRSIDIPIYFEKGRPGNRTCTMEFKIKVVGRFTKSLGATIDNPATVGLGISLDEWKRARNDSPIKWEVRDYPLLERKLTRNDCIDIITSSGLPIPSKSACWFCPYLPVEGWRELAERDPGLFHKGVELDEMLRERSLSLNRGATFLCKNRKPLIELTPTHAVEFGDDDGDDISCDAGACFL